LDKKWAKDKCETAKGDGVTIAFFYICVGKGDKIQLLLALQNGYLLIFCETT